MVRGNAGPDRRFAIIRTVAMNRQFTFLISAAILIAICYPASAKTQPVCSQLPQSFLIHGAIEERESPSNTARTRIDKNLIPDFGEVTPTLYRGGEPKKHGFEALKKMGIQIVVDLRGDREVERQELARLGIKYVPMPWQCSFPKDRIFAAFITLIRENPDKKIFVHCRVGDDRTGMMVAAYRMVEQGWSAKKAKQEMLTYGFNFTHRHLICPRLADYEEEFPKRFATEPEFENLRATKRGQPAQ
jgi:protein tyrosine phosphatase (PTP) superfamily phosphohydrolase (DUF442 family)